MLIPLAGGAEHCRVDWQPDKRMLSFVNQGLRTCICSILPASAGPCAVACSCPGCSRRRCTAAALHLLAAQTVQAGAPAATSSSTYGLWLLLVTSLTAAWAGRLIRPHIVSLADAAGPGFGDAVGLSADGPFLVRAACLLARQASEGRTNLPRGSQGLYG